MSLNQIIHQVSKLLCMSTVIYTCCSCPLLTLCYIIIIDDDDSAISSDTLKEGTEHSGIPSNSLLYLSLLLIDYNILLLQ